MARPASSPASDQATAVKVIPAMTAAGRGSIINVSSISGLGGDHGLSFYNATKGAVCNLTRSLAIEFAQEGVRVNAIAPGFFIADQNRAVLINADGSYTTRALTIIAHTPMGRFGRPEELNAAVQWLCSDSASFVTGVVLPVDGGFSAFSGV